MNRWQWAGGAPYSMSVSRLFHTATAEASPLNLRILHRKVDTLGAEASCLDLALQERSSFYVADEQETRFTILGFVADNQELRYLLAGFVTDTQETRFIIAQTIGDDQETRFRIAIFAADDQETRFDIGGFVEDNQELRFILSNSVADEQEFRYLIANLGIKEQETRFTIANYVSDPQELRFILSNFVTDEQELRFLLANFYARNLPIYFYIAGTGIIVYEPSEGYLLDDSYIAQIPRVSRLLQVRYAIGTWPKWAVDNFRPLRYIIAASGVGELPAKPPTPAQAPSGSQWYMLCSYLSPGTKKIHDVYCDDFGHVANQYHVIRWSAAAQQYTEAITPKAACLANALGFLEGHWVYAPVGQYDYAGSPVTGEQSVALVSGWNSVGAAYSIRMDNILVEVGSTRQPLNYSGDKVGGVFYCSYDGSGNYSTIDVAVPDTMIRGRGYWVRAFVPCNLVFREGLT